jgi:hypothetical protein
MSYLIAAFGVRLVLAVVIYVGTTALWVSNTRGWEALGLFAMSIIFGAFAAVALVGAAAIGRRIQGGWPRLVAHPPLVIVLFALLAYVIGGAFMGMQNDIVKDIKPFLGLVAVLSIVDAVVGYWLDGWVTRKQAAA